MTNKPSRKRIAIVIDTLNGGGAEKVCITLTRTLQALGAEAFLIVIKKKCDYPIPNDIPVYFVSDDEQLKLHKNAVQQCLAYSLCQLATSLGGFNLIVSNLDGSHPVVIKSKLKNVVYVIHNSVKHEIRRAVKMGPIKYWRKRQIFNYLKGKNLIAVSEGLETEIRTHHYPKAASIQTIYNPLDIEEVQSLAVAHDPDIPKDRYIIHIGRKALMKRHDILLSAFDKMKDPCKLVLLCNKPENLKPLLLKSKRREDIIVPNFKNNPYPWIKNAQALVLSSDYEGFGMVLVEALACGTPVVSTDCEHGPNEILTDELAEYLVPVGKPDLLAQKIDACLRAEFEVRNAPILGKIAARLAAEKYLRLADTALEIT